MLLTLQQEHDTPEDAFAGEVGSTVRASGVAIVEDVVPCSVLDNLVKEEAAD